jgi:signal transduction histidine kinase/CheY-like chemotaxis protein
MTPTDAEMRSSNLKQKAKPKPKPRSMQSRFILMEAATVSLALLLMAGSLAISSVVRTQISSSIESLQDRLSLQTQIHEVFDRAMEDFWRAYPPTDADMVQLYRSDENRIRSLTSSLSQSSASADENNDAGGLQQGEEDLFSVADRMLSRVDGGKEVLADEHELAAKQRTLTGIFRETSENAFVRLGEANRKLRNYNRILYILLLVLGFFPVAMMLWFQHAHARHIWTPLERLYQMVIEVKEGNLDVGGEIPSTVELGTLTSAFLNMASELREMRNSLEEKARQRAAQLEAANKDLLRAAKLAALGQLVSGVAHEINNPLTSILGFSEVVLSRPKLEPALRGQVQTIRVEALRLRQLVSNLSSFSRRGSENLNRIDLRTIPDRLLQLRSYQLSANNIKVRYDRPAQPVWAEADSEQILQVLLHLVLNSEQAIKSCREKGEIMIRCATGADTASISVEDDGCGMPPEICEHIFDPFFTTKSPGMGAGLGLSISHSIVERHGGRLTIASTPGKGTMVSVHLPPASTAENHPREEDAPHALLRPADPETAAAMPKTAQPSMRILAIDDEPEILHLVSVVLSRTGAQVVTLQDSTQLGSMLKEGSFDAVLCDLKMPGQDGLAVLRTLREKAPKLAEHFLLMTGNMADADKARIDLEGVPILPKPFSLGQLRERLGQVVSAGK